MAAPEERLEILRQNNPFTSSSVGDPWEGTYPDVPSINEQAFKGLCQLIDQKTKNPALNCAGLILGEVGSGKTHLISRLLTYNQQAKTPFSFAYIQPIEDPEQTYRYLLREVIVNLCHPMGGSPYTTQLERILAEIFREVIQIHGTPKDRKNLGEILRRRIGIFKQVVPKQVEDIQHKAVRLLRKEHPEISKNFLKVLFQYRLPEKHSAAVSWLTGSILDQEDADLLQVQSPDRLKASTSALEQESWDILISLGLLLARYHQPLVICFDRLENLETDEQIRALGKMLEFLIDKVKGMLPLACFRGQKWGETFRNKLNQHIITRLETNKFELTGCTAEQALDIIRSRLASVLGERRPDEFFPFDKQELLKMFKTGFHVPRRVIAQANQRLRQILNEGPPIPIFPLQKLQEEFEHQYQTILRDPDRHQPDRGRLRRALELYLSYRPPEGSFRIESLKRRGEGEKYIDFIGTIRSSGPPSVPAIFMIDVEQHPASVGAGLLRGIEFLKANPSGKAFYIRDARCIFPPPPKWKVTNEKLRLFKELGGSVIFLSFEQAARWYALALLSYTIKEGDVTIITADNRIRSVSFEEFTTFIQKNIYGRKDMAFQAFEEASMSPRGQKSEDPPPPSDRGGTQGAAPLQDLYVAEKIVEILRGVPMMMLPARKLVESLTQSGVSIDLEGMTRVISKFQDRFTTIPSKDGVLIMLKKSWIYVQG